MTPFQKKFPFYYEWSNIGAWSVFISW